MSLVYEMAVQPFLEFAFLRRALVAVLALAVAAGPIGTLLILRRMSLVGDAMSHAVLPGAAIGFLLAGLSLPWMSLGGAIAGLTVALLAGFVTRATSLREDASFATFYILSIAAGVMIVSLSGSSVDLLHVLFGSILAVDGPALLLVAGIVSVTLLAVALLYRPLVAASADPDFLRARGGGEGVLHAAFLVLLVLNLVAAFQALGTLLAIGLLMLPAAGARFWVRSLPRLMLLSSAFAALSGYAGLVISYAADLPSGPSIVLSAGALYLLSLVVGPVGGLRQRYF
jgi:zinc/manganese transport system permease protein